MSASKNAYVKWTTVPASPPRRAFVACPRASARAYSANGPRARKEANEAGISLRGEFNIPASLTYGKRTAYGVSSADANVHGSNQAGVIQELSAPMALSLQANSVLTAAGATQLSGFAGDVKLPTMPGNAVVSDGGNGAANEGDAIDVGSSAFGSVTLKPTRFAGAVDISKHLMYSMNGQLDDLFGRDLSNAIASNLTNTSLVKW